MTKLFLRFKQTLSIIVFFLPVYLSAQEVSGTIATEDGTLLRGATILEQGTTNGTISDTNGKFVITLTSDNPTLLASYIGYQAQEVAVNGQSTIAIQMVESFSQLEEILVTGYGTQEEQDVTGAVSSVKGAEFENLPVFSASQAIQGRASGVELVRTNGAPGSGGELRIRGLGTINASGPLVVIDGFPGGSINDVQPNDIESIEILKDASAAAIYGTRAANGVVIITTRRGRQNEKISVTLNAYGGFSNELNTVDVLDAATLAELKRERYVNDGIDGDPIWSNPQFQTQLTDWQEELLETGVIQNYDFSIRGGGEKSSFAISGGYFDEEGLIKNTFYERYSLRINSDHQINKRFKIGQSLQLTRVEENGIGTNSAQSGILWSAIRFHPGLPVFLDDGEYSTSSINPNEFGDINNPIFTADTEDDLQTTLRLLGTIYAEVEIIDGLTARANFGLDGSVFDRDNFEIIIDNQTRTRDRNRENRFYREDYSVLAEYFLTYDKTIAEQHNVNFVAGYSSQEFVRDEFGASRRDFDNEDPDLRFLSVGADIAGADGGKVENKLLSGFGRLNYNFADRYLLTVTVRADGSSRFGQGNRWGTFPAFSAGWRISSEPFFENVPVISHLKVTGGWGQLGNQDVAPNQFLGLIAVDRRYSFGGEQAVGARLTRIPNPDIGWETAEVTNIGLDVGFLNNKLLAKFNYFIKDTEDMLLAPPTLGSVGTAAQANRNVGEIRNQGLETEIGYRNNFGDISFSVDANASFIENEVTRLFEGNFLASRRYGRPNQEIARTFEGESVGTFFGWRADGLYQTIEEIESDPNIANDERRINGQIEPGDVRFIDLNEDGIVDENDREIIGDPFPDVSYGLNTSVGWKGIDLTLFFLGVAGNDIYNADRMQGLDPTFPFNLYAETEGRWTGPGTSNSIPRMTTRRNNLNHRTSDLFVESGSFFRLKNLQLGYSFPTSLIQGIGLSNVRVYFTGQNLFTITDYSGIDPELGYVDGNLQRGVDYAQYPQARTWTFGASVTF